MSTHFISGSANVSPFIKLAVLGAIIAFVNVSRSVAIAQPVPTQPIPIAQASGKTGALRVTMTQRSPLSAPAEIAKRVKLKPEELAKDYGLSKQSFSVYIPASPAEDGKYGLLVGLVFAGGHGFAPALWKPVLDKHHLIWIAPDNGGDNQPALDRIGYALDTAANAPQVWPIDGERVYLSCNTRGAPSCMGLYYPDVFPAVVSSLNIGWFADVQAFTPQPYTLKVDALPVPPPQYLAMAKADSRFFFADRENPDLGNRIPVANTIFRRAYMGGGFRIAKMNKFPKSEMDIWTTYAGTWLDQGIEYVESAKKATKAPVASATQPATQSSPKPSAQAAPASDAAAKSLNLAKSYISAKRYDQARPRLESVIGEYPNTPAAKEAQTLLNQIRGL